MTDRVALATGGTQGIGFAVAERLLADGASVCITDCKADPDHHVKAQVAP